MVKISEISRIYEYAFHTKLPSGLRDHLLGGMNQDLCVWCRQYASHDRSLITLYGEDITNGYELETNYQYEVSCCQKCLELFNLAVNANSQSAREARYYLGVHGALLDDLYLQKEGYYDDGVNSDKCCTCKGECGKNLRIMPPVSNETERIYSLLSVCEFCEKELERILQGKDLFESYQKDSCPKCDAEYHITASELSYRKNMGTLGQHYCPECCMTSELSGLKRFNPTSCDAYDCANTTMVDITHIDFLETPDGKNFCELHSQNNEHMIVIDQYKVSARKIDGLYYYSITMIHSTDPRGDELLYDSEEYNEWFDKEYNALFHGSSQVYSIIQLMELQRENKELKKTIQTILKNMRGEE